MSAIRENLQKLYQRIRSLEEKYHRPPHSVSLVAISKGQSIEKMEEALAFGQYLFGENYLQEALIKMASLRAPLLEWHFTGTIQSNKTQKLAEHFAWVHTVASQKVAERLNAQRPAQLPPLNICLEVNLSQEDSKSGLMTLEAVQTLATLCLSLPRLKLRGLMAIPAPYSLFAEQRAEFHRLAAMKETLCQQGFELDTLSMGMTDDLEAAIAEGATFIRVGRGIFGQRSAQPFPLEQ